MRASPLRAVKVMFREKLSTDEDVDVVKVNEEVVNEVKCHLEETANEMIEKTKMGEWRVGYLEMNP